MENKKSTYTLNVRLAADEKKMLDDIAQADHDGLTGMIKKLIIDYWRKLKSQGIINP